MGRWNIGGVLSALAMKIFCDIKDYVDHVRNATRAFAALVEFPVNHGRNDQLPGIRLEQAADDPLDLAIGDHIALADKHSFSPAGDDRAHRAPSKHDCQCQ